MGWEWRGGSGPYYTRSKRKGSRVVREYVGRGELAGLVAAFDRQERAEREAAAAAWRAEKQRHAADDALLDDLCRVTSDLATACLLDAGYYQHHREWRRRAS